jgi:hypothetical protein
MNIEPTQDLGAEQWIVDENVRVERDPIPIGDHTWAIHGSIPVDGDVLVAKFDSRDDADAALARIAAAERDAP